MMYFTGLGSVEQSPDPVAPTIFCVGILQPAVCRKIATFRPLRRFLNRRRRWRDSDSWPVDADLQTDSLDVITDSVGPA